LKDKLNISKNLLIPNNNLKIIFNLHTILLIYQFKIIKNTQNHPNKISNNLHQALFNSRNTSREKQSELSAKRVNTISTAKRDIFIYFHTNTFSPSRFFKQQRSYEWINQATSHERKLEESAIISERSQN